MSFQGYIQNFFVVSGQNGHGFQCPTVDLDCPTCGEFRNLQNSVQALQDQYLREIQQLRQRVSEKSFFSPIYTQSTQYSLVYVASPKNKVCLLVMRHYLEPFLTSADLQTLIFYVFTLQGITKASFIYRFVKSKNTKPQTIIMQYRNVNKTTELSK